MRRAAVIAAAAALVAGCAASGAGTKPAERLVGTVQVNDSGMGDRLFRRALDEATVNNGANRTAVAGAYKQMVQALKTSQPVPCAGALDGGGFDDVGPGGQVVIADENGKTIAATQLDGGLMTAGTDGQANMCTFRFTTTVPDAGFYKVTVGRRPPITYSADQLKSAGWAVNLTIG